MSQQDREDHSAGDRPLEPESAPMAPAVAESENAGSEAAADAVAAAPEPARAGATGEGAAAAERGAGTDDGGAQEADTPARSGPPRYPEADGDGGHGGRGSPMALLLAVAALALGGYNWWQGQQQAPDQQATAEAVTPEQLATGIADATRTLRAAMNEQMGTATVQLERLESASEALEALGASVARLETRLDALEDGAGRLTELDTQLAAIDGRLEAIAGEARSAGRQATTAEAALREQIDALDRRFDTIQGAVSRMAELRQTGEDVLRIGEAEFLLRLAAERIELFGDPGGAVQAMEIAARYLQAVDDPLYNGVRRTLSAEIDRLRAVEMPDRASLSGRLQQLAEASMDWPLDDRRSLDRSANLLEPTERTEGLWGRVRSLVSDIAVVHRDTGEATMLLTLEEEQLLRENVRLQLQVAQLALIRAEEALYQSALGLVGTWLETYYDPGSEVVRAARNQVQTLAATPIAPQLPDLGEALRELRQARSTGGMAESAQ